MDTRLYARPDCRICKGSGFVDEGKNLMNPLCLCVIYGQRRSVAQAMIAHHFPPRAREMTLDSFQTGDVPQNQRALAIARRLVEHWEEACRQGWVLGFWGKPATGKTHLVNGIALACVERYLTRPLVLSVPRLLRIERQRFGPNREQGVSMIEQAIEAELLVLDDLGAEYHRQRDEGGVSWVEEVLYQILDERVLAARPLLYTTNLSPQDLRVKLGSLGSGAERLWSRIARAEVGPAVEVRRVESAAHPNQSARSLLYGG